MTAALEGQQHALAALYPRERLGTHCTEGWVGPRAGLDGRKISSPTGFDPEPSSSVAQSLYRLSYRAKLYYYILVHIIPGEPVNILSDFPEDYPGGRESLMFS